MGEYAHGDFGTMKRAKLILVGLLLAAFGGLAVWFGRTGVFSNETVFQNHERNDVENNVRKAPPQTLRDRDADGLKDWEEAVWKTDPGNPDTDADGTFDGEEIAKNRDPLKKGPDDRVLDAQALAGGASDALAENLTYNLTRGLIESGVLNSIDREGRITSTDFLDKLLLPKDLDPDALLARGPIITERDLAVTAANDAQAIKNYFNALYDVYHRIMTAHQKRGDLAIVAEALQTENYELLAELEPIMSALDRAIAEIKALPAPPDYRLFTVQELNYLAKTRRAIEIFRNAQTDPLATALVLRKRIELFQDMARLHADIKRGLDQRGIVFEPNEGGYAYFR